MDTSILDCAPGINMTCLDAYFAAAYRVRRSTNVAMSPSLASPKTLNIVPAVLLELPDREGVIKVQAPTAILLLIANTILMYLCVYRF